MNWIQVLLIGSIVALLVYLLRSRRSARSKAWVKVGYVLFVLAGVYAVLRPDDTTVVAHWFGVRRGTDLMLYALIMAFSFTTLSTYMRFKDLELRYARLARAVALEGAQPARAQRELRAQVGRARRSSRSAIVLATEVLHRAAHAFVQRNLRAPAQNPFRPSRCRGRTASDHPAAAEELRVVGPAHGRGHRGVQLAV